MQDYVSKALNLCWTKAFVEGYVIITKLKQNLLLVVMITLKKCIWKNSKRNKKRGLNIIMILF